MKKLTLSMIQILFIGIILAQTPVPPGPISGTWDIGGSPYMVNGEIYVPINETLNIEPGVEVRFTGWYKFIIYGALNAIGEEGNTILFTADDTNDRWHGIRFTETSQNSALEYCIIEYGQTVLDASSIPDNCGGGISCYLSSQAEILIKNCLIRNNIAWFGGGIQCISASPTIINSEITQNTASSGGAMECYDQASPEIINCLIADNHANIYAGALQFWESCSPLIKGNTIIHNTTSGDGGALRIGYCEEYLVERNIIAHNNADLSGGAVNFYTSIGTFKNNTISHNQAGNYGGGIFLQFSSNPDFLNDLIYFNTALDPNGGNQVYIADDGSDPDFSYCNIEEGSNGFRGPGSGVNFTGIYWECIDEDPLFADALNDDFSITWMNYPVEDTTKSPCIDRGSPNIGSDPDSTCCDIGAYCFFQQLDVPVALLADSITNTSFLAQWTNAYGALGYYLDVAEDMNFTIWVLKDQQIDEGTTYLLEGLTPNTTYYYRIRSFNTALTSNYSNVEEVTTTWTGLIEVNTDQVSMYASRHSIYVNVKSTGSIPGEVCVYNLSGQQLKRRQLVAGTTIVGLEVPDQIVIVKVIYMGKAYQQKMMLR